MSTSSSLNHPERPLHLFSKVGQPFLAVRLPPPRRPSIFIPSVFINLQIPRPATPVFSHLYKPPGYGGLRRWSVQMGRSDFQTIPSVFRHLQALCLLGKTQVLCFQENPNSFCKTPGVGVCRSAPAAGNLKCEIFTDSLFSQPYELLFPQSL